MTGDPRYDNARALFDRARRTVGALESLKLQVDAIADDYGTISGVSYDREGGHSTPDHGDDATERAVSKHDALWERLQESADRYAELLLTAENAIAAMEEDGACTMGDAETLRLYFLQAKKSEDVARVLHYNSSYIRDKIELAVIHVAPYVPSIW